MGSWGQRGGSGQLDILPSEWKMGQNETAGGIFSKKRGGRKYEGKNEELGVVTGGRVDEYVQGSLSQDVSKRTNGSAGKRNKKPGKKGVASDWE